MASTAQKVEPVESCNRLPGPRRISFRRYYVQEDYQLQAQIKQAQVQGDLQKDQAELAMDQQRMQNKASEFQQRLASQERMTGDKIDAAREREGPVSGGARGR